MTRYVVIIVALFLAGCATSKQFITPDGQVGHFIDCTGNVGDFSLCLDKASSLCPNGYKVLDSTNQVEVRSNMGHIFNPELPRTLAVRVGHLMISCKEPKKKR